MKLAQLSLSKALAQTCNSENRKDEQIRDCLVHSIKDQALRQKLFKKGPLTLDVCTLLIRNAEVIPFCSQQFKPEVDALTLISDHTSPEEFLQTDGWTGAIVADGKAAALCVKISLRRQEVRLLRTQPHAEAQYVCPGTEKNAKTGSLRPRDTYRPYTSFLTSPLIAMTLAHTTSCYILSFRSPVLARPWHFVSSTYSENWK